MRVSRIDYAVAHVDFTPGATTSPGHAPATRTPEGYLLVDALIARDGLLVYSDGETSWQEYRPRAELVKAAASWRTAPVTDDHPQKMVDAETWVQVAKGVHAGEPRVEGPLADGVSYLRAPLLVTDASLIRKLDAGVQRQLSIGFTSEVVPAVNGCAPDGTRCDAVQTSLLGNHTACVDRGRAGPTVRVLMDGHEVPMTKPALDLRKLNRRHDEVGAPVTTQEVIGPDGQTATVPSWVAAILEQFMQMQAAQPQAPADASTNAQRPAAPPMVPSPVIPQAPQAAAPAIPVPPAPVPAPQAAIPVPPAPAQRTADEPAPPAADPEKKPDDEDDEPMKDAAQALAPIRRKIDRLAALEGVPAEILDSDDSVAIARAFIAKRAPGFKALADAAQGEALRALVEAAATMPTTVQPVAANPWERPRVVTDAAPEDDGVLAFLKSQGYAAA